MEKDIEIRIEKDFKENTEIVLDIISNFENTMRLSPRVTRSIVHLSEGNLVKLKEVIALAIQDWRDVITSAESYDFEFNEPFKNV